MQKLPSEEYVEQAYLFRALSQRMTSTDPVQDMLGHLREEILATTKLPMAIDYLLAELNHVGTMSTAMGKLAHYFTPFQTYLVAAAESEAGRFDMNLALLIMEHEAKFRAAHAPPTSMFFFQFETISRNRLAYDTGLEAISQDPVYDEEWSRWILKVRHQIGIVDLADLVYVHSEHYLQRQQQAAQAQVQIPEPILFGEKEGRIALANRSKEPMFLFSALQRHLNYPAVPKPKRRDPNQDLIPKLVRTLERIEVRLKLLEDEQREKGIDLSQFYDSDNQPGFE
ncbi:MAG: hypothetical protein MK108_07470 [Mariniblastus sp.]|nr:hypothetical protein [Mariniblastus sp.]